MSVIGDSASWHNKLIGVYELVHEAIIRAWPDCREGIQSRTVIDTPSVSGRRRRKNKQKLEDPITRCLIRRLRQDREIRSRFHVESQRELLEEAMELDPDPKGYIDIAILFFMDLREGCLALECKRLNVMWPSKRTPTTLAREYVYKGMMRFVSGQYSEDCSLGGMVGYVMDGNVTAAHESIVEQISTASLALLCDPSQINVFSYPDYFSTTHVRRPTQIELRHQLLPAN
jgi:hypothetical protein